MPDIKVRITNLPQIRAAFKQSPRLMTRELNKAIALSVAQIERDSAENTPVKTGTLRRSTYQMLFNLKGIVGTHTNYDLFVHEGTRYMKGRPYLRKAVNENSDEMNRYFTNAVQRVLTTIGNQT